MINKMIPKRIQLRRTKGWRLPPNTIVVSRPGKWGNPFRVGGYFMLGDPDPDRIHFSMIWCQSLIGPDDGFTLIETREEAVAWFRKLKERHPLSEKEKSELRGKNLACWCPITDADGHRVPCHADVLLELANA